MFFKCMKTIDIDNYGLTAKNIEKMSTFLIPKVWLDLLDY